MYLAYLACSAGTSGEGERDGGDRMRHVEDRRADREGIAWAEDLDHGRGDVLLGGTDNLEYKIEYLVAVLEKLGSGKSGTIDLTFETEKTARFQPY